MKRLNKKPDTLESEYKPVVVGLHLDGHSTEFSGAEILLTEMKLRYMLHCSAWQNNHKGRDGNSEKPHATEDEELY